MTQRDLFARETAHERAAYQRKVRDGGDLDEDYTDDGEDTDVEDRS